MDLYCFGAQKSAGFKTPGSREMGFSLGEFMAITNIDPLIRFHESYMSFSSVNFGLLNNSRQLSGWNSGALRQDAL